MNKMEFMKEVSNIIQTAHLDWKVECYEVESYDGCQPYMSVDIGNKTFELKLVDEFLH